MANSQLVFLDLDNTLIPTSWIMDQWRTSPERTLKRRDEINRKLVVGGLFDALERFFEGLKASATVPQKVVIVTNAAVKTVDSFYLGFMLPQLGAILAKYDVSICSTEVWLEVCGPVPNAANEKAFREYYTHKKLLQFRKELASFTQGLPSKVDIVSVGDQLCEITAACRLALSNEFIVRQCSLLLVLDIDKCQAPTCPRHFSKVSQHSKVHLDRDLKRFYALSSLWHGSMDLLL